MRFWNNELWNNEEAVLEKIRETKCYPHPGPLPERERAQTIPSPLRGEG
ncbi:hypothetical protein [Enterobacter cloacae]